MLTQILQAIGYGILMAVLTAIVVIGPIIAAGLLRKRDDNR